MCSGSRAVNMQGIKRLRSGIVQNTDEVDYCICPLASRSHRFRVSQIGLNGSDLADSTQRLQMASQIRPADRNAHAVPTAHEFANNMTADKAGTADDRNEAVCGVCQDFHL